MKGAAGSSSVTAPEDPCSPAALLAGPGDLGQCCPLSGPQLVLREWLSSWVLWEAGILWSRVLSSIALLSLLGF